MEYLIGLFLALGISIGATLIGFDRERSFYPTVLMVIALLYAVEVCQLKWASSMRTTGPAAFA
jgi:hypothetical protein